MYDGVRGLGASSDQGGSRRRFATALSLFAADFRAVPCGEESRPVD